MLKVAYCDDFKQDRENIAIALTQIEEKWQEKIEADSFSNGEDLCKQLVRNHYHVILLDVRMDGMDGIETARRIRNQGDDSLIIFISNDDDRIRELFDYGTIAFLDKPIDIVALEKALHKSYDVLCKERERYFSYIEKGSVQYVPMKDILYFESKRNKIWIHTVKGEECFYDTLSSVWEKMALNPFFIMPHRSYIFNLKHVKIQSKKVIVKESNEVFNIGKKYLDLTQKRYSNYIEMRWK